MVGADEVASPGSAHGSPLLRLRRGLGRVRRQFVRDTFDVYVRPVLPEHADFTPPDAYEFRWATAVDIEAADPHHTELDAAERAEGVRRLGLGHRAVAGLAGDTLAFTMWVNPNNLHVPGQIKRPLAPHQAFIYKAYTSPDHRGRSLYKAGMRFVLSEMARAGQTELVGYAHVKKAVSRKGLASLEFESRGRFFTLGAFGRTLTHVSSELDRHFPTTPTPPR
jgi:hypothetical protein